MDLFVANVDQEMYSLYHNNKDETFSDLALPNGIGSTTRLMSGWGLKFFDYDNDGNLDLLLCNGHPDDKIEGRVFAVKFREPLLLFRNTGNGLENVSSQSGPVFERPLAARGWRSAISTTMAPWTSWWPKRWAASPAAKQCWKTESLARLAIGRAEGEH